MLHSVAKMREKVSASWQKERKRWPKKLKCSLEKDRAAYVAASDCESASAVILLINRNIEALQIVCRKGAYEGDGGRFVLFSVRPVFADRVCGSVPGCPPAVWVFGFAVRLPRAEARCGFRFPENGGVC